MLVQVGEKVCDIVLENKEYQSRPASQVPPEQRRQCRAEQEQKQS